MPGFRAHLVSGDGKRGPDLWIESGQITALTEGSRVVRIGYGLEAKSIPFTLRLVDFEVPRDEGTDTPSNFLATIEFRNAATGDTKIGVAKMNHPASFPGTLLANFTGINYKFSQAEWNPQESRRNHPSSPLRSGLAFEMDRVSWNLFRHCDHVLLETRKPQYSANSKTSSELRVMLPGCASHSITECSTSFRYSSGVLDDSLEHSADSQPLRMGQK